MFKKEQVVCIIPARGGSKGIPGKNKKPFNGKPLVAHAIQAAKQSDYIDRIIISTDDEQIARIGERYGAEVPVMRPKKYAGDASPTLDSVLHMIDHLRKNGFAPGISVLVQPTSPLVTSADIDACIESLSSRIDACVSVCEVSERPEAMYFIKAGKVVEFLKEQLDAPRQKLPTLHRLNGAVYVTRVAALRKYGFIVPGKTRALVMPKERSVDIDDMLDFEIAEFIMQTYGRSKKLG
ncbi:MAG TPA: acylneuraminate cytidylyltransferase family protein [Candidatus Paceibacterota bacterium]|nr:acylneuraminate cytidylyltransferase family protein [Candidatus Paceibacterota bacterium]